MTIQREQFVSKPPIIYIVAVPQTEENGENCCPSMLLFNNSFQPYAYTDIFYSFQSNSRHEKWPLLSLTLFAPLHAKLALTFFQTRELM